VQKKRKPRFRLTPKHQARFTFSAEDVVRLFLNIHNDWFTTPTNAMFGMRSQIRKVLLTYLLKNEDIAQRKEEIYALNKFQREFVEDECVFGRIE
jgi:hypothetical protein